MQRQRQQQQQREEEEVGELPLRITGIQIEGAKYLNPKVPVQYLQLLNQCNTLAQLTPAAAVISNHMIASGHYKDVKFNFIPNEHNEMTNNVRVFCTVVETDQRGVDATLAASPDSTLPSVKAAYWSKNFFAGNGEKLKISASTNHKLSASDGSIELSGLKNAFNSAYQYHVKGSHGVLTREWVDPNTHSISSISLGGSSYDNASSIQYEIARRTTSDSQGEEKGSNIKSALSLTRSKNFLDNCILPRAGTYYKDTVEISGLLGDTQALKYTTHNQSHTPLNSMTTLSLTLDGGIQQPLRSIASYIMNKNSTNEDFKGEEDYPEIPVHDRFFANTLTTRTVSPTEIGPKLNQHAAGADAFISAGAMISFAVPALQDVPVRPHIFLNASHFLSIGSLVRSKVGAGVKHTDISQFTASAGIGVTVAMAKGKVEVNYGCPLKDGQVFKPTLSIGFSGSMDW